MATNYIPMIANREKNYTPEELKILDLMAQKFPTIADAATEIVNLEAIMNLPKGTEHFLTDLHGEYAAFQHVQIGRASCRERV